MGGDGLMLSRIFFMLTCGARPMCAFVTSFTRVFVVGFTAMFTATYAPGFGAAISTIVRAWYIIFFIFFFIIWVGILIIGGLHIGRNGSC